MIADNGKGMSELDIMQFATFSLDVESRGNYDSNSLGISKFGVGAKHAGFYLGDSIRVLTKTKECDRILEFSLEDSKMKERYDNHDNVIGDEI